MSVIRVHRGPMPLKSRGSSTWKLYSSSVCRGMSKGIRSRPVSCGHSARGRLSPPDCPGRVQTLCCSAGTLLNLACSVNLTQMLLPGRRSTSANV